MGIEETKKWLKQWEKKKEKIKKDYKKGYEILMEFWDCIPDEQKQDVHSKLKGCGL